MSKKALANEKKGITEQIDTNIIRQNWKDDRKRVIEREGSDGKRVRNREWGVKERRGKEREGERKEECKRW